LGQDRAKPHLCMIITRCESKDDAQRDKLLDEFKNDTEHKRISESFGRGIHFFGALNHDDWNRANEALIDQFETVYNYRKNLLRLIRTDIKPFHMPADQSESHRLSSISRLFFKIYNMRK
ncbi:unnamed protein product, partial [Rotaria sp. Silwood1]